MSSIHAKSKGSGDGKEEVVTLIHSHHLLDHKPDNMILTGKKFKLRGVACLGRPGVALCIGSRSNVKKFTGKLRGAMPQKKFGIVNIEVDCDDANDDGTSASAAAVSVLDEAVDGFEEASLAGLRELLTSVGQEDQFFALVGIDNPTTKSQTPNSNADVGNSTGSGVSESAGRRKKKKRG